MRQLTASTSAMAIGLLTCFGGAGLAEAATMDELERRIERLESLLRERDIDVPKDGPDNRTTRASAAEVQVGPQRATFGNDLPVQERLDELTPPPAAATPAVAKTEKPATTVAPEKGFAIGENTRLWIGGYVKVNANYSDFSTGQSSDNDRELYTPSRVNVGNEKGSEATDISARWTRINFNTATQAGGHEVTSYVEFDFFGEDASETAVNSYGLRLRDAIFELDKTWLFGQTDSTFMDVAANPETLDQIGPSESQALVRQAQIRYTRDNFAIGIENPSTTLDADPRGNNTNATSLEENFPELAANYNWPNRFGHLNAGAVLKQVSNEGVINPATGDTYKDDSTVGYGLRLSGKVKVGQSGDDVKFSTIYGDGLGRYVGLGVVPAGYVQGNGNVETIPYFAAFVGYKHLWAPKWRSNFVLGTLHVDNKGARQFGQGNLATKRANSVHANLIWSPITPLSFGGEYIYADREVESGQDGNIDRLQFSAKYAF